MCRRQQLRKCRGISYEGYPCSLPSGHGCYYLSPGASSVYHFYVLEDEEDPSRSTIYQWYTSAYDSAPIRFSSSTRGLYRRILKFINEQEVD